MMYQILFFLSYYTIHIPNTVCSREKSAEYFYFNDELVKIRWTKNVFDEKKTVDERKLDEKRFSPDRYFSGKKSIKKIVKKWNVGKSGKKGWSG